MSDISQLAHEALEERIAHPRPACGVATDQGGVAGGRCDTSPGGRGPACRETANRVGRVQHRDYGWSGGFARVRLRRPGGERGDFTAPTKAITRRVGSSRSGPQNASGADYRHS